MTPLVTLAPVAPADALRSVRRRNWAAIAAATPVMMFSYFSYGAAFVDSTTGEETFDIGFAAVGLTVAPFVFVVLAFGSRNPAAPRHVLAAMGLLLAIGLPVGLIDPLLGAATGFAAGGAATLNRPRVERVLRWRIAAVAFTAVYLLVLLVVAGPAGVFSGGVLPLVMIGFADEYAAWSASRPAT